MQDELNPDELREELTADIGNRLAIQEMAKRHECTYTDICYAIGRTPVFKKWCKAHADVTEKYESRRYGWTVENEARLIELYKSGINLERLIYGTFEYNPEKVRYKLTQLHKERKIPYRRGKAV